MFLARAPCTTALIITAVCADTAPMLLGKDPASTDDPLSRSLGHGQHPPFPVRYFSKTTMMRQDILAHIRADAPQALIHMFTDNCLHSKIVIYPYVIGPREFMAVAPQ